MKTINLGKSGLKVPAVAVGCMRMGDLEQKEADNYIAEAVDMGAVFFDHADIYGAGKCEEMFGKYLHKNPALRDRIILQSKCSIVPGVMYDCSKKHILESVDGILKRLQTEYLDVLLLHRPDALVEPEEVAEAFDLLESSGKVRHFGVSNHKPSQIRLLKKYVKQDIAADQHSQFPNGGKRRGSKHADGGRGGPGRKRAGFLPSGGYHHSDLVAVPVWIF